MKIFGVPKTGLSSSVTERSKICPILYMVPFDRYQPVAVKLPTFKSSGIEVEKEYVIVIHCQLCSLTGPHFSVLLANELENKFLAYFNLFSTMERE